MSREQCERVLSLLLHLCFADLSVEKRNANRTQRSSVAYAAIQIFSIVKSPATFFFNYLPLYGDFPSRTRQSRSDSGIALQISARDNARPSLLLGTRNNRCPLLSEFSNALRRRKSSRAFRGSLERKRVAVLGHNCWNIISPLSGIANEVAGRDGK